jgi:hypothetical protein
VSAIPGSGILQAETDRAHFARVVARLVAYQKIFPDFQNADLGCYLLVKISANRTEQVLVGHIRKRWRLISLFNVDGHEARPPDISCLDSAERETGSTIVGYGCGSE